MFTNRTLALGVGGVHLMDNFNMDKLEAVQRVLRFSESVRNWCEKDEKIFFDDFDNENVMNYDTSGHGELADMILEKGIEEGFIDKDDLD